MAFTIPTIFSAIDQMTAPIRRMGAAIRDFATGGEAAIGRLDRQLNKIGSRAEKISKGTAIAGAAIVAPLVLAAKSAVDFEDRMADIGKTTGLQGEALKSFGRDLLKMSAGTRSSIEDLQKIGEIGGQLGVANTELIAFTDASNKFAVALGGDYSGGVEQAITSVGKLKNLFKETRSIPIAEAITRAGSAINQLGAVGAGTSENINDFALRMGALPDALKPSLTATVAMGTFFEELGINSEIASSGLTQVLTIGAKNLAGFGKQMHMTARQSKELLQNSPTEFVKSFASSLQGLAPDQLAKKLHDLKLNSNETIKVIGALGSGTARMTELQKISAAAFADGTSLQSEYNTKNKTTAALLAQAKNNFEALSITVGTKLIPIVTKLLEKITPFITSISEWIEKNPKLTEGIVMAAGAIGGLMFAISAVSGVIAIITKATWLWQAAQWVLNIALSANPIGLIILGIAALITLVVLIIKYWDQWGAALVLFLGPIGWVISAIKSIYDNWGLVTKAFKEGGILEGIKAIGKVLLDVILKPLEVILGILADLPGPLKGIAKAGQDAVADFRHGMGLGGEGFDGTLPAVDPNKVHREGMASMINGMVKQNLQVEVSAAPGTSAEVKKGSGIQPKVTSTMQGGFGPNYGR